MNFLIDLPGAAVKLYQTIRQDHEIQDWLRLLLSCIFSGFLGLTGAWGTMLIGGKTAWVAFGYGLCGCAVSVLTVLLRMKQGRQLMISTPQEVVKEYQASTGETVIEPEKK